MDVSVGIICHNEGRNIGPLLSRVCHQEHGSWTMKEIICVASGCTDLTEAVIKGHRKTDPRIRLICEKERRGKVSAINQFIMSAKNDILVMMSGDITPEYGAIDHLLKPFEDKNVGITGGRPVPTNIKNTYLSDAVRMQWALHHRISTGKPKFGEMIAFRNVFKSLSDTAVDEEMIANTIRSLGFRGVYCPDAIIYNKGPENLKDFLKQRRRIYCGHLDLKKRYNYSVPTLKSTSVLAAYAKEFDKTPIVSAIYAASIEAYARILGYKDHITMKDHTVWDIAETTK